MNDQLCLSVCHLRLTSENIECWTDFPFSWVRVLYYLLQMWQAILLPSLFIEESFSGVLPICTDDGTVSGCEHDSYLTNRPKSLLKTQPCFCLTGRKKGIKTGWEAFISVWSLRLNGVREQWCSGVKLLYFHCLVWGAVVLKISNTVSSFHGAKTTQSCQS